jgi:hypothetical protein
VSADRNQDCPLCQRPARYGFELAGARDRKHFSCSFCTEFVITTGAEKLLVATPELAMHCSDLARTTPARMILEVRSQLFVRGGRTRFKLISGYAERRKR